MRCVAQRRELGLECVDLGTEDEAARGEHAPEGVDQSVLQLLVLAAEGDERDPV
jgi:hypothetical protein